MVCCIVRLLCVDLRFELEIISLVLRIFLCNGKVCSTGIVNEKSICGWLDDSGVDWDKREVLL